MRPSHTTKRARVAAVAAGLLAATVMSLTVPQGAAGQGIGRRSSVASVTLVATKPESAPGVTLVRGARDQIGGDAAGAMRVSLALGPDADDEAFYVRDARGQMRLLGADRPVIICESASTCERASVEFRQLSQESAGRGEVLLRVRYTLQLATADGVQNVFLTRVVHLTMSPVRVPGLP